MSFKLWPLALALVLFTEVNLAIIFVITVKSQFYDNVGQNNIQRKIYNRDKHQDKHKN